jgi:hypothetical protein
MERQRNGSQPQHNGSALAATRASLLGVNPDTPERRTTMTARLARLAGLGTALTVFLVTAAGCDPAGSTSDHGAATADSPSAVAPRDALLNAVPDESTGAYHFAIKGGSTPMSGVLDAPKKTIRLEISQHEANPDFTLDMKFLVIEQKAWTKITITPSALPGLPKLPNKWMLLDTRKIKDKDNGPLAYGQEADPGSAMAVFQNASDVQRTSTGHFAGVTDLTKATEAEIVDGATLTALGDKAKKIPFTAVVDTKGRLTSAVVKIPATAKTKAAIYAITYDGYDSTETPVAPAAGEQQKAVSAVYEMLNG